MKNLLRKSIPFVDVYYANAIIDKNIAKIADEEYLLDEIDFDRELLDYDSTLEIKKSIDDKAKSVIMTVSVSVSISTSLVAVFLNNKFHDYIFLGGALLGFMSLVNMIIAASLSLHELGEKNIISYFPSGQRSNPTDDNRILIKKCHLQNIQRNITRNNLISASYRHIVIGMIILCVLFVSLIMGAYFYNRDVNINKNLFESNTQIEIDDLELRLDNFEKSNVLNEERIKNLLIINNKLENRIYQIENSKPEVILPEISTK